MYNAKEEHYVVKFKLFIWSFPLTEGQVNRHFIFVVLLGKLTIY